MGRKKQLKRDKNPLNAEPSFPNQPLSLQLTLSSNCVIKCSDIRPALVLAGESVSSSSWTKTCTTPLQQWKSKDQIQKVKINFTRMVLRLRTASFSVDYVSCLDSGTYQQKRVDVKLTIETRFYVNKNWKQTIKQTYSYWSHHWHPLSCKEK